MNILILGGAGFIGTNLSIALAKDPNNQITVADRNSAFFRPLQRLNLQQIRYEETDLSEMADFDRLVCGQEVVYHLVSTTVPSTSNRHISQELTANVVFSSNLFESCVRNHVKKVIFISSGGTVYGKEAHCPLREDASTNPISSYGVQKITIEKLLYLYRYMYGLDYRIVRLANPYGPYQRPNGVLGAVTTFVYKAINGQEIVVYGDGTVVRDFIYIDDAIRAILTIADHEDLHRTFNVGSGQGISIRQLLEIIETALGQQLRVRCEPGRPVDVPVNFLDVSRYESRYGAICTVPLDEGIRKTAQFMRSDAFRLA